MTHRRMLALGILACSALAIAAPAAAQGLEGDWSGVLQAGPKRLRLALHVTPAPEGLPNVSLDSLDQGAKGIPGRVIERNGATAQMLFLDAGAGYAAKLSDDGNTLTGKWSQGPVELPLVFTRTTAAAAKP